MPLSNLVAGVQAQLALAQPADQRGPAGLYAYVIRPNHTVERRTIKVGPVREGLAAIRAADNPKRLEDLYLPYKPKKKTKASDARERGLEPLALRIWTRDETLTDLSAAAQEFLNPEKELDTVEKVLEGVGHILAEAISEMANVRDAVRRVAAGGTAMDPEVIARLLARNTGNTSIGALSPREREVLALMAEGRSNVAIAQRLVITERAVAKHTASIFLKLDLQPSDDDNRRVLAVLAYLNA